MTDFNKSNIFNSFIKGQFNYCFLLWMFSTRTVNHKIHRHTIKKLRYYYSCKKYPKINDWILKISLRSFSSHNERSFFKQKNLSITFEIVDKLFCQILNPKNMTLIRYLIKFSNFGICYHQVKKVCHR